MCVYMHTYTHVHIFVYTYIHIYVYIHTHIHIYVLRACALDKALLRTAAPPALASARPAAEHLRSLGRI